MKSEIKIPVGKQIDESTFKIVDKDLPKTYKEYCELNSIDSDKYYISACNHLISIEYPGEKSLSTIEEAKAILALIQLIRLRDYYNKHSENTPIKYAIVFNRNKIRGCKLNVGENRVLMFNSESLANKFLNNFRDLIEQAKYLI